MPLSTVFQLHHGNRPKRQQQYTKYYTKNEYELEYFEKVHSFCSTNGALYVFLVKNLVVSHK